MKVGLFLITPDGEDYTLAGETLDGTNPGVKALAKILVDMSSRDLGPLFIVFKCILSRSLVVLQHCRYRSNEHEMSNNC